MGNNTQTDTLKALVKEQQEHIRKLEQQVSFQNTVIKQYESEIEASRKKANEMIQLCSDRLKEASELKDKYKGIISEITQIRSEYDASLAELIASIRSYR